MREIITIENEVSRCSIPDNKIHLKEYMYSHLNVSNLYYCFTSLRFPYIFHDRLGSSKCEVNIRFNINGFVEWAEHWEKFSFIVSQPAFAHDHLPKTIPVGIYLLKVNNRNTRTRCEICSKLTIKTPEWRQRHRSGVFIVNFEHTLHLVLLFLLLTLNM